MNQNPIPAKRFLCSIVEAHRQNQSLASRAAPRADSKTKEQKHPQAQTADWSPIPTNWASSIAEAHLQSLNSAEKVAMPAHSWTQEPRAWSHLDHE